MPLKPLRPTFNNPRLWRSPWKSVCSLCHDPKREKGIKIKILERDEYTCAYCSFQCDRYMIVHHSNDNPNDWNPKNLEVICQMCNIILHVGQGAVIQNVVELYKKANYSQNEIITKTRHLRMEGKEDSEIIEILGLKENVEFQQDPTYLKPLFGFISSRQPPAGMTHDGLLYQYLYYKQQHQQKVQKEHTSLPSFTITPKMIKPQEQASIAHIILQAVANEQTGKHKLAAFLRGSKSQLIRDPGLDRKQGYGALLWHDILTIEGFIDQLLQMELIKTYKVQTGDFTYPILQLTDAGRNVLLEKKSVPLVVRRVIKPVSVGESEQETLTLFRKGLKPDEIAARRGLARSTIFGHLHTLIAVGNISAKQCVADHVITKVLRARQKLGAQARLKEFKEMLSSEITYEEIRAVLADKKLG